LLIVMVRAPHSSEYICRTAFRFFFSSVYLRSSPRRNHILQRQASGQAHVYRPCRPTDVAVVRPPSVFLPPWPPDLVCGVDLLRHLPAPLPCTCWPALVHLSILTCHTHTHTVVLRRLWRCRWCHCALGFTARPQWISGGAGYFPRGRALKYTRENCMKGQACHALGTHTS
jgi:hypothetical protein